MDTKTVELKLTKISQSLYNAIRTEHQVKFEELYGWFPAEFIEDHNGMITNISKSPAEECWDILNLSLRSLSIVISTDIKPDAPVLRIYDIHELITFAIEGGKRQNLS